MYDNNLPDFLLKNLADFQAAAMQYYFMVFPWTNAKMRIFHNCVFFKSTMQNHLILKDIPQKNLLARSSSRCTKSQMYAVYSY
jgi:hypothetical protein